MERKWTDIQYNVQDNTGVSHKYVIMYCNKHQKKPALPFCGPNSKPHGARGLSKHYHLRFYPKLVKCVCETGRISCARVADTSILYKPWISGIPSDKKERYKTVTSFTYWPVLRPLNNWDIIQLSHKSTPSDAFDKIHQLILYGIS